MSLGPVMLDLQGLQLDAEERELLRHPAVGGVILFSRNFSDPEQIQALVAEIHTLREPRLLVAVDQEGGRVQRFREGFTRIPPAARLGALFEQEPKRALRLAETGGWLMAAELRAVGVDLSLAPVLDLGRGLSEVIGDRAFHRLPDTVTRLAQAWIEGMHRAGMAATGKHFPGHGSVAADSHVDIPRDERRLEELLLEDVVPFERLCRNELAAIMPAHVVYPHVDPMPPGFSRHWLQDILRRRLGFQGVIFSDDLTMEGARVAGDTESAAELALEAGCDMVLVCNDRAATHRVLDRLRNHDDPTAHLRLVRLHGRPAPLRAELMQSQAWKQAVNAVAGLEPPQSLDLV